MKKQLCLALAAALLVLAACGAQTPGGQPVESAPASRQPATAAPTPSPTPEPAAEASDEPAAEPESAAPESEAVDVPGSGTELMPEAEMTVSLEVRTDGKMVEEYGHLTGISDRGEVIWERDTAQYGITELARVQEIGMINGYFYYVEGGSVVCVNPWDGSEVWRNDDFGGAQIAFETDGYAIYLAGYYGPCFCAVSVSEGETLCRIESFDDDYYWPSEVMVDLESGMAFVALSGGPEGYDSGEHLFYVELDTWEYGAVNQ